MFYDFPAHDSRQRPLRAGCSISRLDDQAGTLTAIVTKAYRPNQRFALSCEHVLYPLSKQYSAQVCQPANVDTLGLGEFDVIASKIEPAGIDPYTTNDIDAAITRLDPEVHVDSSVMNTEFSLSSIAPVSEAAPGKKVAMVGRTSGEKAGQITDPNDRAWLTQGSLGYEVQIEFSGIASATYDSEPGDSGAPVILLATGELIGMHIGRDDRAPYFAYIQKAFDYFQLVLD